MTIHWRYTSQIGILQKSLKLSVVAPLDYLATQCDTGPCLWKNPNK